MGKYIIIIICFLLASCSIVVSQEVIITDFPLGIAGSIDSNIFEPYYSQLELLADTLAKYPLAMAIVTGGADGIQFSENHDSHNPGLAVGRAHVLRNILVDKFNINPNRIIIKSSDVIDQGGPLRYASIRIDWDIENLDARLDTLSNALHDEKLVSDNMGLQFGLGFSSSPFGGIPITTGAITWKRLIFIECIVGHTIWSNTFRFYNIDLNTRLRMAGGQAILYPVTTIPVGFIGGWIRFEEISRNYSRYVKMSEGLNLGLRVTPHKHFSITSVYNPAKYHIVSDLKSKLRNNQFLFYATVNIVFGGER